MRWTSSRSTLHALFGEELFERSITSVVEAHCKFLAWYARVVSDPLVPLSESPVASDRTNDDCILKKYGIIPSVVCCLSLACTVACLFRYLFLIRCLFRYLFRKNQISERSPCVVCCLSVACTVACSVMFLP